jgi:hypothetical protein
MREILGKAKSVRELLKGVKNSIDYYQREYKWKDKQTDIEARGILYRNLAERIWNPADLLYEVGA